MLALFHSLQKFDIQVNDRDIMRWMWNIILHATFDYPCAIDGAHVVETFDGVSFMDMVKMNGKFGKIEQQLNELFYGCAPFKMKSIILVGSPFWMNWLVAIMRMFISKKMSERIISTDEAGLQARVGGPDYLPQGM
jgi:hypothetical protein